MAEALSLTPPARGGPNPPRGAGGAGGRITWGHGEWPREQHPLREHERHLWDCGAQGPVSPRRERGGEGGQGGE